MLQMATLLSDEKPNKHEHTFNFRTAFLAISPGFRSAPVGTDRHRADRGLSCAGWCRSRSALCRSVPTGAGTDRNRG